jgi:hypothetical protein
MGCINHRIERAGPKRWTITRFQSVSLTEEMRSALVFYEQSQRGSKPCSHLERVDRCVRSVLLIAVPPGQGVARVRRVRCHPSSSIQPMDK